MFENVVNLTPHTIVYEDAAGVRHSIEPSGAVLRCGFEQMAQAQTGIGPVRALKMTDLELVGDMPDGDFSVAVVSGMCAQHRNSLYWGICHELSVVAPDTRIGFDVRENGKTVAVKGWLCYNLPAAPVPFDPGPCDV